MASLFKPTITTYTLPDGKHRTPDGKRVTRTTRGAVKHSHKSGVWYGKFKGADGRRRTVPLCADKTVSKQMLAKLVTDAKLAPLGLADVFEDHRKRPLTEHLADFHRYLESKGNTPAYAAKTGNRVRAVVDGCRFRFIADVSASAVVDWLAGERQAGRIGIQTSNYYLRDVKAFCRWLVRDRRTAFNPLAHVSGMNANVEDHRERRHLEGEDFGALVAAAKVGPIIRGLSGIDRATLYLVAAYTGFRASELASLEPESFDLTADPAAVTVAAAYSKRRREDSQPIRADLAGVLRDWMSGRPAGRPLWPGKDDAPSESWQNHAADMIRADLSAARQAWIEAAGDDADERQRREESNRLAFADRDGRVFDFHALRHQFISNLAAAGVHPKVAQTLARHSTITLTMDRYTHLAIHDQTDALDKLPALPGARNAADLVMTGTDPRAVDRALTKPVRMDGPRLITIDDERTRSDTGLSAKNPLKNKAFANDCGRLTIGDNKDRPRGGMADTGDLKSPLP